jgi:hypothetical protein
MKPMFVLFDLFALFVPAALQRETSEEGGV